MDYFIALGSKLTPMYLYPKRVVIILEELVGLNLLSLALQANTNNMTIAHRTLCSLT